jgi:hypothetical protein
MSYCSSGPGSRQLLPDPSLESSLVPRDIQIRLLSHNVIHGGRETEPLMILVSVTRLISNRRQRLNQAQANSSRYSLALYLTVRLPCGLPVNHLTTRVEIFDRLVVSGADQNLPGPGRTRHGPAKKPPYRLAIMGHSHVPRRSTSNTNHALDILGLF